MEIWYHSFTICNGVFKMLVQLRLARLVSKITY